jgi:hypothetical protein
MEDLRTFHFRLYHERGSLELTPGLVIDEAEGDAARPDILSVSFKGSAGGIAIRVRLITIGDAGYMTNPLTGVWEAGPAGVSSLGFFDPSSGIASMMQGLGEARLLDLADLARPAYVIAGIMPAEALGPLVGATVEHAAVRVRLTIDAERLYLLEARFEGRVTPTDADDAVRMITLSRFDEPVAIEPPI